MKNGSLSFPSLAARALHGQRMLPFLFLLMAAFISSQAFAEERELFSWNADSLNFVVDGEASGCSELMGGSVIDKSVKRAGTGSLRHTFTDAQRNTGCEAKASSRGAGLFDGDSIYWSAWLRLSNDFDWGDYQRKAKFAHLKRTNEQNPVYGVIYIKNSGFEFTGGMISNDLRLSVDLDPSDGGCRGSANGSLQNDCTAWRHYVIRMQQNSCAGCNDGVFEVFVDGVLADRKTNISFASESPSDGVTNYNFAWAGLGGKAYPQMCANGSNCPGIGGSLWVDDMSIKLSTDGQVAAEPKKPRPPQNFVVTQ